MRVKRGDVVLVDYPFGSGGGKVRPSLVVQNNRDNGRLMNTIIVQISSNVSRVHESTQCLIELSREPASGLMRDSATIATNVLTIGQGDILRVLGELSAEAMERVDECLRTAFHL